jgi:hypothetical protein
METERAKRLAEFVAWVGANIKGDKKGGITALPDRLYRDRVPLDLARHFSVSAANPADSGREGRFGLDSPLHDDRRRPNNTLRGKRQCQPT